MRIRCFSLTNALSGKHDRIEIMKNLIHESILHFARENSAPDVTMLLLTRDRNDFDYPTIESFTILLPYLVRIFY